MLNKPSILLSSYGGLHHLRCPNQACAYLPSNSQPSHTTSSSKPSQYKYRQIAQQRYFANVKSEEEYSSSAESLQWPVFESATQIPTPYQIFRQKKGALYSKKRYYELAKIYHPDKHAHRNDSSHPDFISHAVKLERYRLIVAANDILSDPLKRKAYDAYGAGWDGRPELGSTKEPWRYAQGKGWSGFNDNSSPARCATWEDWEKWYQRNSKVKQEPLYFSNGSFVVLIVIFAMLGGLGEISRAGKMSRTFIQQIEAVHDDTSKNLQWRKKESQAFENTDERVQSFLRTRDPVGYGLSDLLEESSRKLLPAPEICMSGDIQNRGPGGT